MSSCGITWNHCGSKMKRSPYASRDVFGSSAPGFFVMLVRRFQPISPRKLPPCHSAFGFSK